MPERAASIDAFLQVAGWGEAMRRPLTGDASARRYIRLHQPGGPRAILMDDPARDTDRFARVARHLRARGLSAPDILAWNSDQGLMLLEDLGDGLLARLCETSPEMEDPVYAAAVDVLIALHGTPAPDWAGPFAAEVMADQATLVLPWYAGNSSEADAGTLRALLKTALAPLDATAPVLLMRDYHAENLIWLPQRDGVQRIGLLDFQDAVSGHPAYDLASLIADARRDLSPGLAERLIAQYAAATGQSPQTVTRDVALLRVQRTLRILGVFARLSQRDGKHHYIDLIPRVWAQLVDALSACASPALADTLLAQMPPPTPEHLTRLRPVCAPHPGQ
ncbi:MAG: phosphotransferase [Pseudomonadota bacterium]